MDTATDLDLRAGDQATIYLLNGERTGEVVRVTDTRIVLRSVSGAVAALSIARVTAAVVHVYA